MTGLGGILAYAKEVPTDDFWKRRHEKMLMAQYENREAVHKKALQDKYNLNLKSFIRSHSTPAHNLIQDDYLQKRADTIAGMINANKGHEGEMTQEIFDAERAFTENELQAATTTKQLEAWRNKPAKTLTNLGLFIKEQINGGKNLKQAFKNIQDNAPEGLEPTLNADGSFSFVGAEKTKVEPHKQAKRALEVTDYILNDAIRYDAFGNKVEGVLTKGGVQWDKDRDRIAKTNKVDPSTIQTHESDIRKRLIDDHQLFNEAYGDNYDYIKKQQKKLTKEEKAQYDEDEDYKAEKNLEWVVTAETEKSVPRRKEEKYTLSNPAPKTPSWQQQKNMNEGREPWDNGDKPTKTIQMKAQDDASKEIIAANANNPNFNAKVWAEQLAPKVMNGKAETILLTDGTKVDAVRFDIGTTKQQEPIPINAMPLAKSNVYKYDPTTKVWSKVAIPFGFKALLGTDAYHVHVDKNNNITNDMGKDAIVIDAFVPHRDPADDTKTISEDRYRIVKDNSTSAAQADLNTMLGLKEEVEQYNKANTGTKKTQPPAEKKADKPAGKVISAAEYQKMNATERAKFRNAGGTYK